MSDSGSFEPLKESERRILRRAATRQGKELNFEKVAKHAKSLQRPNKDFENNHFNQEDPNKAAAIQLSILRNHNSELDFSSEQQRQEHNFIELLYRGITVGKELLEQSGFYWRFKPTIEKILELNITEAKQCTILIRKFEIGDFGLALEQQKNKFFQHFRQWKPEEKSAESIEIGIEAYRDALGIYERGFPVLLGVKRIIDGGNPSLESLQRERASNVRRELTDTTNHENSVYFDLIVKSYEPTLRNALSHGDLIHDPSAKSIRIPNRSTSYSYDEFNDIIGQGLAVAVFLTGMFQDLVYWSYLIHTTEALSRDTLPV